MRVLVLSLPKYGISERLLFASSSRRSQCCSMQVHKRYLNIWTPVLYTFHFTLPSYKVVAGQALNYSSVRNCLVLYIFFSHYVINMLLMWHVDNPFFWIQVQKSPNVEDRVLWFSGNPTKQHTPWLHVLSILPIPRAWSRLGQKHWFQCWSSKLWARGHPWKLTCWPSTVSWARTIFDCCTRCLGDLQYTVLLEQIRKKPFKWNG